jgi:phosphohistidine phosphatase
MELILWRHCEAEPGVPDEARRLTPLGLEHARRVAAWLDERLSANARIVVSPAVRAQQTAQALGRACETSADVGTGTSVDALLDAVAWPDARGVVLVVGHQPTLGRVASQLLEGDAHDQAMRPGAVLWLSSSECWPGREAVLKVAKDVA